MCYVTKDHSAITNFIEFGEKQPTGMDGYIKEFQTTLQTSDTMIDFPASKNTQKQRIIRLTNGMVQAR